MITKYSLAMIVLVASGTLRADYVPTSTCMLNVAGTPTDGITCNIYPSDGAGNFDGDVTINFPMGYNPIAMGVTPGYIVLDSDPANIDYTDPTTGIVGDRDMADWTQVFEFNPLGYTAGFMTLYTTGCFTGSPTDQTCFPTYSQLVASDVAYNNGVSGGAPYEFVTAPAPGGVYTDTCTYSPSCDTYNVNYITPAPAAPEPSSFAMGGLGIIALAWVRRARRRSVAQRETVRRRDEEA